MNRPSLVRHGVAERNLAVGDRTAVGRPVRSALERRRRRDRFHGLRRDADDSMSCRSSRSSCASEDLRAARRSSCCRRDHDMLRTAKSSPLVTWSPAFDSTSITQMCGICVSASTTRSSSFRRRASSSSLRQRVPHHERDSLAVGRPLVGADTFLRVGERPGFAAVGAHQPDLGLRPLAVGGRRAARRGWQ